MGGRGRIKKIAPALALAACSIILGSVILAFASAPSEGFSVGEADDRRAAMEEFVSSQAEQQQTDQADVPAALTAACGQNPEVVAWLYVPGTNVSLPVCRSDDDSFYMTHDYVGDEAPVGAAYMESWNAGGFIDAVTCVYGHSLSDYELMFTQLHRFEDEDFFKEHDEFFVYLPDGGVLTYRIASACLYTDAHVLEAMDPDVEASVQGYMSFAVSPGSSFGFQRDVGDIDAERDRIVQLSTCTLPSQDDARFVVTGVFVGKERL